MTTETTSPTSTINVGDGKSEQAVPKSSTITLTAPSDATMAIVAERKGDGARTYVIVTEDKKSRRGRTESHATWEAAKAATEKMAKEAAKLGWQRKATRKGFVARPDAFSTLPPAPKAKK